MASEPVCERCGEKRHDHWLMNFSDGPLVGKPVMLCPTAIFRAQGYGSDGTQLKVPAPTVVKVQAG